jgi:hypothetical protein
MNVQEQPTQTFEPVIIGFTCNWCSYRAADLAGTARVKYPPNIRLIRMMCSGRLDPTVVMKALAAIQANAITWSRITKRCGATCCCGELCLRWASSPEESSWYGPAQRRASDWLAKLLKW